MHFHPGCVCFTQAAFVSPGLHLFHPGCGCRVIVLEDNDVVHLCKGAYGIFNVGHSDRALAVPRVLQTLEMEVNHIMKGGYNHFMQKEIHEQPESITETMRGRVKFVPSPNKVCQVANDGDHLLCINTHSAAVGIIAFRVLLPMLQQMAHCLVSCQFRVCSSRHQ